MGSIPLTSANPRQNCIGFQVLGTLTRRLLKTHRFKYKFSKKIWVQPQITFVLLSLPLLQEPLLYSNFRTAVLPVIDNIHCSVRIAINYHLIEFWKRPAYLSKTIKVLFQVVTPNQIPNHVGDLQQISNTFLRYWTWRRKCQDEHSLCRMLRQKVIDRHTHAGQSKTGWWKRWMDEPTWPNRSEVVSKIKWTWNIDFW